MNNMGAATRQEIEKFAEKALKNFPGWEMQWTTAGSICIRERKIIFIDERFIGKYPWEAKERVLHECSHINTEDRVHGEEFYREYIKLLKKFML